MNMAEDRAARYAANAERERERARQWYAANKEKGRTKAKAWRAANPERYSDLMREFRKAHPHYHQDHNRESENYRVAGLLRSCLYGALRKRKRVGADWIANARIGALVGCSKPDLVAHIEAQFLTGMSWSNYGRGGWEIDHVKSCASFDLTDPEQQAACFHFTNLRPLWRSDNLQRPKGRA